MFGVDWFDASIVIAFVGSFSNLHGVHVGGGMYGSLLGTVRICSCDSSGDSRRYIEGSVRGRVAAVGGAGREGHVEASAGDSKDAETLKPVKYLLGNAFATLLISKRACSSSFRMRR